MKSSTTVDGWSQGIRTADSQDNEEPRVIAISLDSLAQCINPLT